MAMSYLQTGVGALSPGVPLMTAFAVVMVCTLRLIWKWCNRGPTWGQVVVDDIDRALDGIEPRRVPKVAMEAAMEAKAHYGEMRYNAANRIVVAEFVRKWYKATKPDMRAVDIVKYTPMAVQLALTPSAAEVEAQQYADDGFVRDRRAAVALPK